MDLKEIQNFIKFVSKSGASEIKLETGDLKLTVKTDSNQKSEYVIPQPMTIAHVPHQSTTIPREEIPAIPQRDALQSSDQNDDINSKYVEIKSPMIGTFYRKPSPDKENFVEVGSTINPSDVLCIVEAMKLFNEIESEISGKVIKILVDDMSPIEYDQPLFLVDPS